MFKLQRSAFLPFVLLASSATARASDWYVDAQAGSDLNSGSSAAAAWKTITHALASIPALGPETIHVAPGTYDAALGEVFPWVLRSQAVLQGDQGSALTHITAMPGST